MQITEHSNRENVGACWPEQYGSLDLVAFDCVALFHERDAVPVNGVRDFMAESSRQLLGVVFVTWPEFIGTAVASRRVKETLDCSSLIRQERPKKRARLGVDPRRFALARAGNVKRRGPLPFAEEGGGA